MRKNGAHFQIVPTSQSKHNAFVLPPKQTKSSPQRRRLIQLPDHLFEEFTMSLEMLGNKVTEQQPADATLSASLWQNPQSTMSRRVGNHAVSSETASHKNEYKDTESKAVPAKPGIPAKGPKSGGSQTQLRIQEHKDEFKDVSKEQRPIGAGIPADGSNTVHDKAKRPSAGDINCAPGTEVQIGKKVLGDVMNNFPNAGELLEGAAGIVGDLLKKGSGAGDSLPALPPARKPTQSGQIGS